MDKSLKVEKVTKMIGDNVILDDVSFELEKGKIVGLVGANGSGKSTMLKIILGLYKSDGNVIINGFNIRNNFSEAINSVSGIVDFVSFYEFLTGYENLRYFALLYEVPLKRVMEVLKLVGLKKDKRLVKKYSLGMKQRLGIAIALLKDPSILILDEPMNGLDPLGIIDLRNLLLSFRDKTIIISSHILSEIEKIVDEVLFIKNKKIIQKTVKREDLKSYIKFKVSDYERAKEIMDVKTLNEDTPMYMSDKEVSWCVREMVKDNVEVYRVESESLESELIKMLGGEDDE